MASEDEQKLFQINIRLFYNLKYLSSMASGGHSRLFNNKSGYNSFEKSSVQRDITKNIIRTQHIRMLSIERKDKLMIKLWISMMLKTLMENPLDQIWKVCWSLPMLDKLMMNLLRLLTKETNAAKQCLAEHEDLDNHYVSRLELNLAVTCQKIWIHSWLNRRYILHWFQS